MSWLPVTLFTTCKPFRGETGIMQANALRSWAKLELPILVFGNEEGVAEICQETGAHHMPEIVRSNDGPPLLNSLFERAKALSTTDSLAYLNADIILRPDFISSLKQLDTLGLSPRRTLITGRRQNIPLNQPLANDKNAEAELDTLLDTYGSWDQSNAADMFIFHRESFNQILPLAIGRMQWDNWLLWKARDENLRIIDASGAISNIHPIHGYASHTDGWQQITQGDDAQKNRNYCRGQLLDIAQASTHIFYDNKLEATDADKTPVADRFPVDSKKTMLGGIVYLLSGIDSRSMAETIDGLRCLLWSSKVYFPLDSGDSRLDDSDIKNRLTLALQQIEKNEADQCLQTLQSILVTEVIEHAKQLNASKRPLLIWGSGGLGQRLQSLFDRFQIQYMGFMDSDQQQINTTVNGKPVISNDWKTVKLQTGSTPFIIIASMYYREIADSLRSSGLVHGQDFVA